MHLTIHDANLQKVAFVDNDKQTTLNFYNDTWARNLETGSSTFEFTVFKKAIKSDTASKKAYTAINERAFVSFKYKGRSYVFNVMTVEEDEQTIKCYCENLNLELINEYTNAYKASKAMSFVEYCNVFDILNMAHLKIGINEIADQKRTLEWEGQDTKLARLLSLATKFDAEIEFDTQLNSDSTIKRFALNIYHENDDSHQGVGKVRNDIRLTYGKNLKSIKRKIDKTGIYTMIYPTGKGKTKGPDGNEIETVVTIDSLPAWSEKNADGIVEFRQDGGFLVAPLAAQMYPSTFNTGSQADQWIRKDMEVDSDNPNTIRASAIANLRKNAYPALTYEVDGYVDAEIGDTIKIYDDGFSPALMVKARVSEQKISFSNPSNNKTVFANFKAIQNRLSSGIKGALERLFEASQPYEIKIATDSGLVFKNHTGQSIITPSLSKGGKPIVTNVTWRFTSGDEVAAGLTKKVTGASVDGTKTYVVAGYIGNNEVAKDEITFVNINDGEAGPRGQDGKGQYIHIAYADDKEGNGFSLTAQDKVYIGMYRDFIAIDSTDPRAYQWNKWKGDKGALDQEQIDAINNKIDSKADNTLTQEQLNALSERQTLQDAELQAKASMATVNEWLQAYQTFLESNEADKKEAEEALVRASGRITKIETNFGEMSEKWTFLDAYMQASNEGLTFGKQDGSSTIQISEDRISMFSAGEEVMYIAQGVIHIENGIFSKTIQIGRFREEQYHSNLDMNVMRYVGEN